MPERYAKREMDNEFLDGIDSYAYRHPVPAPPLGAALVDPGSAGPVEQARATSAPPKEGSR